MATYFSAPSESVSDTVTNASLHFNSEMLGVPSDLLFDKKGLLYDSEATVSSCDVFECPSPPPPTSSQYMTTARTRVIGTAHYKMMGLASEDEALRQLIDSGTTAVLFHTQSGRLLLAINQSSPPTRCLFRVLMTILPNGDRYWGIENEKRKLGVAFANKERLLQFYVITPQAALMSYFDV